MPPEVGTVVDAGGVRENLGLVEQGGGGDVGDHKPEEIPGVSERNGGQAFVDVRVDEAVDATLADAHQVGEGDGGVVEGQGERRAVEVAAGEDVARSPKTSGLSVAEPASVSMTSRTWARAPRTAPWTCGMQRRQ